MDLLAEEDAKALTKMYVNYGELISRERKNSELKVASQTEDQDEARLRRNFWLRLLILRKDIVNVETSYSNLFNHTADVRAENKVIQWYISTSYLLYRKTPIVMILDPLFEGNDFEQKLANIL